MSEPMSAVEIEDVLSSIRRLVSEELRPLKRSAQATTLRDDKLMLTPALRVVVDPSAEPPKDHGTIIGRLADALPPESSFEAETGDAEPVAVDIARHWTEDDTIEIAEMVIDAEAEDAGVEDFVFHSRLAQAPSAADAGAAPALDGEILEPEATSATLSEPAWAQEGAPDDAGDDRNPATVPEDAPKEEGAFAEVRSTNDPVWADQAEAEVMAALTSPRPEQDRPEPTAQPATARQATEDRDPSPFSEDLQFDETVLRDLVRDLIREELQGSLGERITRNVRKLVRAEVARALSLHDFE